MHLVSAYLDLNNASVRGHDRGVERLVAVRFGEGDIILQLAGEWFVERVDDAERAVAVGNGWDDDTKRGDVGDLGDVVALTGGLLAQAPETLGSHRRPEVFKAPPCELS